MNSRMKNIGALVLNQQYKRAKAYGFTRLNSKLSVGDCLALVTRKGLGKPTT